MPSPYSFLSIPIWLWDLIVHFDSIYCLTLIFATLVMSGLAYRHVPRTFFATPHRNLAEGRAGHVGRPSSPSRNASLKASQQTAPHPGQTYPFRKPQPYDAFLVMDFEATCIATSRFNYANEVIEFPVALLKWEDKTSDGTASQLSIVDEFRSFVKPTWKPILSEYCTTLTGIAQVQVDEAPSLSEVFSLLKVFMAKHKLIDKDTEQILTRFCWCTDGPWDIQDLLLKTCFISKTPMPAWMQGNILDVRAQVTSWMHAQNPGNRPRPLGIVRQLNALGLSDFEGSMHSGIDDTRNIARIVIELARRGVALRPNLGINVHRRWPWMGKNGKVIEEYI